MYTLAGLALLQAVWKDLAEAEAISAKPAQTHSTGGSFNPIMQATHCHLIPDHLLASGHGYALTLLVSALATHVLFLPTAHFSGPKTRQTHMYITSAGAIRAWNGTEQQMLDFNGFYSMLELPERMAYAHMGMPCFGSM